MKIASILMNTDPWSLISLKYYRVRMLRIMNHVYAKEKTYGFFNKIVKRYASVNEFPPIPPLFSCILYIINIIKS